MKPPSDNISPDLLYGWYSSRSGGKLRRSTITDGPRPEILLDLQKTLQTNRLYVRELKAIYELVNTNSPDYRIAINFVKAEYQQDPMKELTMH